MTRPRAPLPHAIRQEIRDSGESLRTLARRYGVDPKTVAKWRGRESVADRPSGPKRPLSTTLNRVEEGVAVFIRENALLPLDDCFYVLQPLIPSLSRTALYRCFARHGVGQLPPSVRRGRAQDVPLGHIRIAICQVLSGDGLLNMFFAFDARSKLTYAEVYRDADAMTAVGFVRTLIDVCPFHIRRLLVPGRVALRTPIDAFADNAMLDRLCADHGIMQQVAPVAELWGSDGARPIYAEACAYQHYPSFEYADENVQRFNLAFNFRAKLKSLGGRTPHAVIRAIWESDPAAFRCGPDMAETTDANQHFPAMMAARLITPPPDMLHGFPEPTETV